MTWFVAIIGGVIVVLLVGGYFIVKRLGSKETEQTYTEGALEGRQEDAKISAAPPVDDPLSGMRSKSDS